jgi:hypothetical protein
LPRGGELGLRPGCAGLADIGEPPVGADPAAVGRLRQCVAPRALANPRTGNYENFYTRFDMQPGFESEFVNSRVGILKATKNRNWIGAI